MKVALIAPPYPLEEAPSPPLGICYVAAACEAAGAEVRIFDYIVSRFTPEQFCRQLDAFQPDVVGATSVTLNFPAGADILKIAKQHNPSLITLMGGPHVTFDAENTLNLYPEIDAIVLGEGERTLMQWLPVSGNRSAWKAIKGLAFMDDHRFVTTGPGEFIENLDELPLPSRHLLPLSRYKALGFPISLITSRGCPNQCIFCLGRKMVGSKVRYRDPALVVDEIEAILSMGFERINIADDLFTANKNRVRALCGEILTRDIRFGWSAFARVDTVDEETLAVMRKAGCDAVSFGIESGNPEMLKRVKKRITLDQARQAVRACKNTGMIAHASFMAGLPGESAETLTDTINFARELDIEHGFHFLSPFPGTTVREHLAEYDLEILSNDWTRYDANSAIVRTSRISPAEMEALITDAYRPMVEAWEAAKKQCLDGGGTDKERLAVKSEKRLKLIFDILSNDMIEELGNFTAAGDDPVRALGVRIARKTGMEEGLICNYLNLWKVKNYLTYAETGGQVRWAWNPNPAGKP
ncbi:MAG: radical SAM protein [Desulfosalsimonadaceae bacterium]